MKKIIAIILIMGGVMTSFAQVPTKMFEKTWRLKNTQDFKFPEAMLPKKRCPLLMSLHCLKKIKQ
jgi:hypothetical protein